MDGGGVGGWYSWQKEPRAAHWFFLFQIKKGTAKSTKMAILRKKGTLGNQWQSLINSHGLLQNVKAFDHHVVQLHQVRQPDTPPCWEDQVVAVERGEAGVPGHRQGDQDGLLSLPLEALVHLEGCAGWGLEQQSVRNPTSWTAQQINHVIILSCNSHPRMLNPSVQNLRLAFYRVLSSSMSLVSLATLPIILVYQCNQIYIVRSLIHADILN